MPFGTNTPTIDHIEDLNGNVINLFRNKMDPKETGGGCWEIAVAPRGCNIAHSLAARQPDGNVAAAFFTSLAQAQAFIDAKPDGVIDYVPLAISDPFRLVGSLAILQHLGRTHVTFDPDPADLNQVGDAYPIGEVLQRALSWYDQPAAVHSAA